MSPPHPRVPAEHPSVRLNSRLSAVRHRRADQRGGHERHHDPDPAGEAGHRGVVPVPVEGESLARVRAAHAGRVQHRRRPLRIPPRPDPAPQPGQGRPGPHQDPPGPRPGPRARRGADLHLAHRRQARRDHDHQPAERRPAAATPHPSPGGWTPGSVYAILRNPKYTGHMVYGRRRSTGSRRFHTVPQDQWIWSPEPAHPAIITRDTWDTAQGIGAEHASARDEPGPAPTPPPAAPTCCGHAAGAGTANAAWPAASSAPTPATPATSTTAARTTRPTPATPPPPPTTPAPSASAKTTSSPSSSEFFATRVFGPDRAAMLAERLPATAAEDTTRREQETARLHKRLRKIDAAENAHAREIENLASLPQSSPAITALRSRIIERFTELETERTEINERLAALDRATGHQDEPGAAGRPAHARRRPAPTPRQHPRPPVRRLRPGTDLQQARPPGHHLRHHHTQHPAALATIIAGSEPPTGPRGLAHSPQHPRMSSLSQRRQTL